MWAHYSDDGEVGKRHAAGEGEGGAGAGGESEEEDGGGEEEVDADAAAAAAAKFDFSDLNARVTKAIDKLGGEVMPKLNWSSPQDAAWLNGGTMRCSTAGDVYLLLKSSDFVSHDLNYPFDGCTAEGAEDRAGDIASGHDRQVPQSMPSDASAHTAEPPESPAQTAPNPPAPQQAEVDALAASILPPQAPPAPASSFAGDTDPMTASVAADPSGVNYTLVLRRWSNLYPQMLFRVFVRERTVVGISQRDCTAYFPGLARDSGRIESAIVNFHTEAIGNRFPDTNYVMDVYIDKNWRVWLIDFNVWAERTNSLLFSWEEPALSGAFPPLAPNSPSSSAADATSGILRLADQQTIRADPLNVYRAPVDMYSFTAAAGGNQDDDVASFAQFMEKCEKKPPT